MLELGAGGREPLEALQGLLATGRAARAQRRSHELLEQGGLAIGRGPEDPEVAPADAEPRELGRRPGSQHEVTRTVPAPAELGIEVLRVPEGSPVQLDWRLEAVMEGVLVTGAATVTLVGECARCLESIDDELDVTFQELFVYSDQGSHQAEDEEDDGASRLEGDLLDLEPLLRDAVVLALPFQPLCQEDCPGLCTECGVRLADAPGHGHDEQVDPRWAALQQLAGQQEPGPAGPTGRTRGLTEE